MLIKFEVKNFKNFKDNFVFDLSESNNYEFNQECIKNESVHKAMIYGTNGCGKSNLGLAIFDLVSHLTDKRSVPELYANYINAEGDQKEAEFKFVFKFYDAVLEYSYRKKDYNLISYELLKINNTTIVEYELGNRIKINKLKGAETLNTDLSNSNISAIKYIMRNTALSNRSLISKVFKQFYDFINKILFFRVVFSGNTYIGYQEGITDIVKDILEKKHLDDFESFLNRAGISCELKPIEINERKDIGWVLGNKTLRFMNIASTGTKSLTLFYYWLQYLRENEVSLVFIDEFDAFYHHELSEFVVKELKKLDVQVILTTHNTSIMTNDLLRPDCYFLMTKDTIKPLSKCTDKELRFAHNLEKMYRAEAFHV